MSRPGGLHGPEALLCAVSALGADRVLFSVDYPWVTPQDGVACFDNTPMSDSEREKISHLIAEKLLRL